MKDVPFRSKLLALGFGTFIMVLTKASGSGIAALFIFIMVMDGLCKSRIKDALICIVTSVIGLTIGKVSWKWSLMYENSILHWETSKITPSNIINLIRNFSESDMKIFEKYARDYAYPNSSLNFISISYIMWFVIIILLILYLNKHYFNNTKRSMRIIIGVVISIIIYSLTLLLMYYFIWGAALDDGGSFYRYMNSLYFGFVMAFGILAWQALGDKSKKNKEKLAIVILVISISLCRPYQVVRLMGFPINILCGDVSSGSQIIEYEKDIPLNEMIVVGTWRENKTFYKYVPYFFCCVDGEEALQSAIHEKQAKYICVVDDMEWDDELVPQCVYEVNEINGEMSYSLFTKMEENNR